MLPWGTPDRTGKKLEYEAYTLPSVGKIRTEPEP